MRYPLDRPALLRTLLASLTRGRVEVLPAEFNPARKSADATYGWEGTTLHIRIRVDGDQEGAVRAVVHELLHAHLDERLMQTVTGDALEVCIAGLEEGCVRYLERHPASYRRWRAAIASKMQQEAV